MSHSGFLQDPFEKAFCKKKKAHKSQPDQDEINLISDFQKLRIIDTFEHVQERQQKETIMTPTLKQILQQSPVPEETLNQNGEIDFENIENTHPMINEYIADDIKTNNELEESNKDQDKIVVGVFDDVTDFIPSSMLKAKPYIEETRREEEEEEERNDEVYMPRFPDDEEEEEKDELMVVKTMVNYAYNLTSSSDDSSDPNSNSETDGMYPSDNDSDRNSEISDFDDDYD